jgi:hypothetical protein
MRNMFMSASMFNQDISYWNVELVTQYNGFMTNSGILLYNVPLKFIPEDAIYVTIYNAANFEGDFLILPPGDYEDNWLAPRGFNDHINSINVPSGLQATVYGENWGGTQATYTSDAASVINSISSIRVRII